MSLASLALGSLGLFKPAVLISAALVIFGTGLADLLLSRRNLAKGPVSYRVGRAEAIAIGVAAGLVLLMALNPTLFYDAVTYHLGLPRQYLMAGSTAPLSWHPYSYFPSAQELLLGLGLAGGGILAAQIVAGGLALAAVVMIRDLAARFTGPGRGGLALVVALSAVGILLAGLMVTDDPLALLLGLGGLFCLGGAEEAAARQDLNELRGWAMGWAVLAGGAAGVKYTLWITALLLQGIMLVWIARPAGWRGMRSATAALLLSFLILLPWPLRNFISVMNPVMPVPVAGLFSGLPEASWKVMQGDAHAVRWSLSALPGIAASPWTMVFARWDNLTDQWGAAAFPGPLLWMGAPLLLLARNKARVPRSLWVYALLATGVSLASFRMTRFAFPGLGAMAVVAAAGLAWFKEISRQDRAARILLHFALAGVMLISAAIFLKAGANLSAGFRYLQVRGDLTTYMEERARLSPFDAGSIPLQLRADRELAPDAVVLMAGETRLCYLDRAAAAPSFLSGNPLLVLLSRQGDEDTARSLRAMGFTHVLVSMPELARLNQAGLLGLTPELEDKVRAFSHGPWCVPALGDEAAGAVICRIK
jgi:hypothetical protein